MPPANARARRRSGAGRPRRRRACPRAHSRLRLGHGVAGLCHGRPETELDAAAYALQAPGKLCCLLAHRRRQLAVVTKRVSELGRQDRAAAARELLDHLCVLQHRFAGDLGRRRRRRATEHEFEALERTALERRAVETANRRQLVQAVDDPVEVNHSASPAASCRCSSSVATDASSTRRPTYTRSTSATESVMSPVSTTPLFRTRSTSSSRVTSWASTGRPESLMAGRAPPERSCTAARAPSPRAERRRSHLQPPSAPPRSVK